MKNRKGQIAMFVIIAVLLIATIGFFFLIRRGDAPVIQTEREFDPKSFLGNCIRDVLRDKADMLIASGGVLEPADFFLHDGQHAAYLCKNINFYEACINQYPRLIEHMRIELKDGTRAHIEQCLKIFKSELTARQYEVSISPLDSFDIVLKPNSIEALLVVDVRLSKNEVSQTFSEFSTGLISPLYELAIIASEIVRQEAEFCYFEYAGFSILYPRFEVSVETKSDSTKIYTLKDNDSGESMAFAIRGCALPQGI